MKVTIPEYSPYLRQLQKKEESEKVRANILQYKQVGAGTLLADELNELLFCDENVISQILKTTQKNEEGLYTISISQNLCKQKNLKISIFDDNEMNYDETNSLWTIIEDVFDKDGKYNADNTIDACKKQLRYFGFDVVTFELLNPNGQDIKEKCLEIQFRILKSLPSWIDDATVIKSIDYRFEDEKDFAVLESETEQIDIIQSLFNQLGNYVVKVIWSKINKAKHNKDTPQ